MNKLEAKTKKAFEDLGFTVLKKGWPDFLCVKNNKAFAIEVKSENHDLSPDQKMMHKCLILLGVPVFVSKNSSQMNRVGREMLTKPILQQIMEEVNDLKEAYDQLNKQIKSLEEIVDTASVFFEESSAQPTWIEICTHEQSKVAKEDNYGRTKT